MTEMTGSVVAKPSQPSRPCGVRMGAIEAAEKASRNLISSSVSVSMASTIDVFETVGDDVDGSNSCLMSLAKLSSLGIISMV